MIRALAVSGIMLDLPRLSAKRRSSQKNFHHRDTENTEKKFRAEVKQHKVYVRGVEVVTTAPANRKELMKLTFFALILCFATLAAPVSAKTVVFTNVNVIPMDRERVLANQTVVVKDGLIAEIGDAKKVKVPKDAVRVDGTGKYLIPGLVDMHTHLLSDSNEFPDSIGPDELRVMVANGVTTVRFMIGTPELLALRSRSASGEIAAPTIFVASPHLTGREQGNNFVVNTPEEAREAVRKSKAAGYDFIKITTFIKAEAYEAAVDEAAKQNIRVVGHADSRFVGVERAWKAKQQIEHLDGYMELLLRDDAPMKGSVSDLYIYNPDNWKSFDYIDESKIPEVARKTVASNPYVNPTHHFMKNSFGRLRTEEEIRKQPDFRFYPAKVQQQWLEFYKKNRFINTVPLEKRARWVELREKLIKAIYDAGGKIMTGSDTPEFLWLYGFGMHHELKALKDAGLSNYAVLEAGTKNPSMFLGTIDKVGTIEKGKRADLILLNANPLNDISATENRAGVMLKGNWHTQQELNAWLDESAKAISTSFKEH
jgi:imidazolonepropionase-like amidohydrolase